MHSTVPANFNTSFNIAHAQRLQQCRFRNCNFFYLFRMFTRWLSFGGKGGGSNFEAKPSQSQPQGADLLAASLHLIGFFYNIGEL